MTEASHEIGRQGAYEIKEWLEGTNRFEIPVTVYDLPSMCSVTCLNGDHKTFDMLAYTIPTATNGTTRPVSVECKKYNTAGHQPAEFKKFLAIAYSSTAQTIREHRMDEEREFMWVTFHPFSLSDWPNLCSVSYLRQCVEEHDGLLNEEPIDDTLLAKVAGRIWVVVVSQRQVDIRLSRDELADFTAAMIKGGHRV